VQFNFSPAVSLTSDQVTFNFGDGQTAVVKAACSPVFGGCTAVDSVNHTYTAANTYLITASGVAGGASVSGTKSLVVASACELTLPSAAFSVNTATPRPGDTVSFTDLSTGEITTRTWNFGDDSTSAVTNPTHVYQTVGTYTASLTVGNCKGTSSTSQTITVCGLDVGPTASFVVATADPRAKQPVQFTDTSTNGPTSWSWQFGDAGGIFGGGGTSTQQHPTYTFAEAGTYLVRLTARNCKDESTYEQSVVVGEDNRPVTAAFSWTPAQLAVGTPARFTARTGSAYGDPTEFTWQFPNENETRSGADQDVTFACGGTLPVTLRASRGSFSDTHTENVAVTGDACAPEAVVATDAAKTAGANGTFWQTDMWIFNPSSQQTAIWFAVLQSGGGEVPLPLGPYTVGPKATLFLHNVLDVLSQQAGQDYRKGAIRITFENAEGVAPVVTARTFTPSPSLPGGNYGQSARGVPVWPNSTTSPLWISGLRGDGSTEGFRTNFGLANLRDNAAGGVTVTMYRSDGTPTSRTFSLAPFGYFQDSVRNLFGEEFATAGALAMKVEIPEGIDVEASASVVENLTGDPMQVAATVIPATAVHLPAIIRAAGANNTVWRSSLQLTNPSEQARRWKLTFTPKGNIPGVFREVSIAERASWAQSDLIAWLYDPLTPPETAGVLKITSADGSGVLPVAVARTFNVTAQGTFGHAVPGLTAAMGASAAGGSTRLVLPGLSSEDVGRSNLGFVNLSETETVNFQVFFYGEGGNLLNPDGRPYVLALSPGGWDQDRIENRFRGYFGAELPAGQRAITAEVVVKTGSGGFAYASVVDNVTGDPIWISGQLMH
jgi:PKD repeat protein